MSYLTYFLVLFALLATQIWAAMKLPSECQYLFVAASIFIGLVLVATHT